MKLTTSFLFVMAAASALVAQNKSSSFTGEIMDRQCAQMGSHDAMMQGMNAKNAKECTLACVKNGDSFALMDPRTKKVYPIEDNSKVQEFAGERVQVTGDYDEQANVLKVKNVTRAR